MPLTKNRRFRIREIDGVIFIIILALLHGLIYVFIVPPWQHYDEPNHFEYVWLTATRDGFPDPGDFNPHLTYEVLKSMINHGFYEHLGFTPELGSPYDHKSIPGYSQLGGRPLYYLLLSIPLRLALSLDITNQMYILRLVSLILFLCTVLIGWLVARELTYPQHPIRILVPLTLALLPGYVDIMTSINNDVAAVLIMSFSLWGSVRLVKRGFSLFNFLLAAVPAGLSIVTKSTAVISLIILPISILFSFLRNNHRKYAWGLLLFGAAVAAFSVISWDEAAWWYRSVSQESAVRQRNPNAVLGEYVLMLNSQSEVNPSWTKPLFQPLPISQGEDIRNQEVTFGFWAWSNQPATIQSPMIQMSQFEFVENIDVDQTPRFFAFQTKLENPFPRTWINVQRKLPNNPGLTELYFDGITLVKGYLPIDTIPKFDTASGESGIWGDKRFTNLIRNGSAEKPGLRVNPLFDRLGSKFLGDNTYPSLVLTSLIDWRGAGFLYARASTRMFETFWAKFGWGNVELIGANSYTILRMFVLFLLAGGFIGVYRNWRKIPWDISFLLFVSVMATFVAAFVRGAPYLAVPDIYLPVGRYLYPVIIPVALGFSYGWLELTKPAAVLLRKLEVPVKVSNLINLLSIAEWQVVVYLLLFVFLDVFALISIIMFFKPI